MIPDLAELTKRPPGEVTELSPATIHYDKDMFVFGMSLNNGQRLVGGADWKCSNTVEIPKKLTKIDVIFKKHEKFLYSMIFHGETVAQIGNRHEDWTTDAVKEGRRETVKLEPGEELLGCEMHYG